MTIYLIDDVVVAKECAKMLRLNTDCAALYWSKTAGDIPNDVKSALTVLQNYSDEWLSFVCNKQSKYCELSEQEESAVLESIKVPGILREVLGTGVILSGEPANRVISALEKQSGTEKLVNALKTGKSVIIK